MGLIKVALGTVAGVMANQWKEYFYCNALPANVLVRKGRKRICDNKNTNNDNIIANGSTIAVADGQCMIIVDNGRIVEMCAESGEFTYDSSREPSILVDDLPSAVYDTLHTMWNHSAHISNSSRSQSIYYFNKKEFTGNKYGTAASIRCFGEYSYQVENPILFYNNVCGNIEEDFTREQIDSQMKLEFLNALQPAFHMLLDKGIRYDELTYHATDLGDVLNEILSSQWRDLRGISIASLEVSGVKIPTEDADGIKIEKRRK